MTTTNKPKAIVLGVGPERGLGGALCKRFSHEGHHVFLAGRSPENLELLAMAINEVGGSATPVVCDATNEDNVSELFEIAQSVGNGRVDLAVYNVGNSTPGAIREMDAGYFEKAWRMLCFGSFLFGRECARKMLPGGGTLIYTGASASLRGKAGFGAFNSGKAAQRTLAQAMAKEYGKEGLHVGHVVIDGGIAGEKWFSRLDHEPDQEEMKRFLSLDALTDAYWNLYRQDPSGWSFEVDLRTSIEDW
jgi:NAD(P)-dependent dehydrogenase (short-subunit alcohol dehydrogenase family)